MSVVRKLRDTLKNIEWLLRPSGFRKSHGDHRSAIAKLSADWRAKQRALEAAQSDIKAQLDRLVRVSYSSANVLGHEMQLDPDDSVITRRLRELGVFEPFETDLILERVQPGQVILDIGANIGYYSLQMARQVAQQGHVYAFEPDPENVVLLRQNIRRNRYQNVTVLQQAVGNSETSLKLYRNPENRGDHRTYASTTDRDAVDVSCTTIDKFIDSIDRKVDFIKMDIQGFEGAAIQGMRKLLESDVPLTIFMEFWPRGLTMANTDPSALLDYVKSCGFEVQAIDEQSRQLIPADAEQILKRYPIEPDTDIFFTNLLCTRRVNILSNAA